MQLQNAAKRLSDARQPACHVLCGPLHAFRSSYSFADDRFVRRDGREAAAVPGCRLGRFDPVLEQPRLVAQLVQGNAHDSTHTTQMVARASDHSATPIGMPITTP